MENISQMSLLEVAIYLMEQKRTVQNIYSLIKEVLEMKGLDDEDKSLATELYIDITTSSKFVFVGEDNWDLKIRQRLEEFDKDGSAFNPKTEKKTIQEKADEEDNLSLDEDDSDDDYDSLSHDSDDEEEDYNETDDSEEYEQEDYEDDEEEYDLDNDDLDDYDEDAYNKYMDDYEDMYEE